MNDSSNLNSETLIELAQTLCTQNDFEAVLRMITQKAASLMNAQIAMISMVNPRTHQTLKTLFFEGKSQEAQTFMGKVQQFEAEFQNQLLFFSLWWKGLDDTAAQRLMKDSGEYQYWLQQMRNFKPYTLSEPEEKLINVKNVTGINASRCA